MFQLAKAADWCLGPFVIEFYSQYHGLKLDSIGKLIAISFASNLFVGPLLIGYLNDKADKRFPCGLYGLLLALSCFIRLIKNPFCLIMSQITYGIASSILYSSFESWFCSEVNQEVKDKLVKDTTFAAAFEKSMIGDSLTAVFVSIFAGYLNVK